MDIRKFVALLALAGTSLLTADACGGYDTGGGPPPMDGGVTDVNSPASNRR